MGDKRITDIMRAEELRNLSRILHNTSPEEPVVKYDCKSKIGGMDRWVRIVVQTMWSSDETPKYEGVIGKAVDIHEARLRIDALENMASHDTLTKLLNRDYAEKWIEECLHREGCGRYVMMLLDLDHIKEANVSRGRMFGDELLVHVAESLLQNTGENEIAARISGDEFLVFIKCGSDEEETVRRIASVLSGEYKGFSFSACMGVAEAEGSQKEYVQLFKEADQALMEAKRKGPGHCEFYKNIRRQ